MGAVTVSCVKREKEKVLLLLFKYAVYKNTQQAITSSMAWY